VVELGQDVRDGYSEITKTYDWIAAAHLIEHIADPISWLREIAGKLHAGGTLFLVIPDKQYTFDYFRAQTTLSQLLYNYRRKLTRPTYRRCLIIFSTASKPEMANRSAPPT
jgi:2-polyprenyl-3-methyl-5-hydroxy-6-metoxy-1,4-benzoquinol methylase